MDLRREPERATNPRRDLPDRIRWMYRVRGLASLLSRGAGTAVTVAGYGRRRLRPGSFLLDGEMLQYVVTLYNVTWRNERSVEVLLARRFPEPVRSRQRGRDRQGPRPLRSHRPSGHGKYERAPGVDNVVDVAHLAGS
jgi:hypothetical protein